MQIIINPGTDTRHEIEHIIKLLQSLYGIESAGVISHAMTKTEHHPLPMPNAMPVLLAAPTNPPEPDAVAILSQAPLPAHVLVPILPAAAPALPVTTSNGPDINVPLNLAHTASPGAHSLDVDKEGLPWDERIHANTKTKTAKGLWTRRRNLADEDWTRVRSELLARFRQPGAPELGSIRTEASPSNIENIGTAPQIPSGGPALAPPALPVLPTVTAPTLPVVAPTLPPPAPAGVVPTGITWQTLMNLVSSKQTEGKCDIKKMNEIVHRYGVTPFPMLATREEVWPQVYAEFQAL